MHLNLSSSVLFQMVRVREEAQWQVSSFCSEPASHYSYLSQYRDFSQIKTVCCIMSSTSKQEFLTLDLCGIFLKNFFYFLAVSDLSCGTRDLSLRLTSSVVVVRRLSCPTVCGGHLAPRPGIETASPALEGGFFTTGSPGKSLWHFNINHSHSQ